MSICSSAVLKGIQQRITVRLLKHILSEQLNWQATSKFLCAPNSWMIQASYSVRLNPYTVIHISWVLCIFSAKLESNVDLSSSSGRGFTWQTAICLMTIPQQMVAKPKHSVSIVTLGTLAFCDRPLPLHPCVWVQSVCVLTSFMLLRSRNQSIAENYIASINHITGIWCHIVKWGWWGVALAHILPRFIQ